MRWDGAISMRSRGGGAGGGDPQRGGPCRLCESGGRESRGVVRDGSAGGDDSQCGGPCFLRVRRSGESRCRSDGSDQNCGANDSRGGQNIFGRHRWSSFCQGVELELKNDNDRPGIEWIERKTRARVVVHGIADNKYAYRTDSCRIRISLVLLGPGLGGAAISLSLDSRIAKARVKGKDEGWRRATFMDKRCSHMVLGGPAISISWYPA
ncbi:hypothetical protein C8J57DRAFT_1245863 [Mycena rebaudengoi]|nr:hypothetical protein C8J57DRAFT_1245863 [Mycena rebaudengoi]